MPHNYNQAGDLVRLLRERAASRPDTAAYTFLPDSEGEWPAFCTMNSRDDVHASCRAKAVAGGQIMS